MLREGKFQFNTQFRKPMMCRVMNGAARNRLFLRWDRVDLHSLAPMRRSLRSVAPFGSSMEPWCR